MDREPPLMSVIIFSVESTKVMIPSRHIAVGHVLEGHESPKVVDGDWDMNRHYHNSEIHNFVWKCEEIALNPDMNTFAASSKEIRWQKVYAEARDDVPAAARTQKGYMP